MSGGWGGWWGGCLDSAVSRLLLVWCLSDDGECTASQLRFLKFYGMGLARPFLPLELWMGGLHHCGAPAHQT